jgi:hypothetical protein
MFIRNPLKPIKSPLQSKKYSQKKTIGFFGFGPQKPNPNRSVWTGSGLVGSFFYGLIVF